MLFFFNEGYLCILLVLQMFIVNPELRNGSYISAGTLCTLNDTQKTARKQHTLSLNANYSVVSKYWDTAIGHSSLHSPPP